MSTTESRPGGMTRRAVLAAGMAAPLAAILKHPASAAEFEYKLATGQDPMHPVNTRAQEALDRIREATGGRLDIKLFPANQLGSDTDLLAQVRSGGVEFFNLSTSILATFVPVAGILNTGFAFKDYEAVWKASDGDLGAYIRAQIAKTTIMTVSRPWDNGFRHITSSTREIKTPDDLKGFKIRVPPAPMLTSLFTALGAGPAPINSTSSTRRCRQRWSRARKTRWRSSRRLGSTRSRSSAALPVMSGTVIGFWATSAHSGACPRICRTSSPASSTARRPISVPMWPSSASRSARI